MENTIIGILVLDNSGDSSSEEAAATIGSPPSAAASGTEVDNCVILSRNRTRF
jgi:hypothetical protein